jgi:endo-1,4-beta-xylanase
VKKQKTFGLFLFLRARGSLGVFMALLIGAAGSAPDRSFAQPLAAGGKKFLGCSVSGIRTIFAKYWNQVTPENAGKWGSVEGRQDSYNWTPLDDIYNYALANGFPYKHHTLVWGSQYPLWITSLDSAGQREQVEEWIRLVGERYPDMNFVDVVNEPFTTPVPFMNALGGTGATGWDWVITVFQWARQYCDPKVKLILNEYNVLQSNAVTGNFLRLIDTLNVRGLIDAIGIQGHSFEFYGSGYSYPVATLESNLNRLAATGLPIYISEFDINDADDAVQLQHYQTYFPLFWENPGVKGMTMWGYLSGDIWRTNAYLLTDRGAERPALKWLRSYIAAPPRPVLISPAAASGVPRNPVLKWHPSDSAKTYRVQLAAGAAFAPVLVDSTLSDTLLRLSPLDANRRYYWRVSAANGKGTSEYSAPASFTTGNLISSVGGIAGTPAGFELHQNYPNPFNPDTRIGFSIGTGCFVELKVYDARGREVRTLVDQSLPAGRHSVHFFTGGLRSGVYFYKIRAGDFEKMEKMTILK